MTKGGVKMSDNSKGSSKRGPLLRTDKKVRPKPKKAAHQTPVAAEEDPRGKYLFYMCKKIRLIKCEHNKLSPSFGFTPDGQPVDYVRYSCALEVETVRPNRFVRSMLYYVLKGVIRNLMYDKIVLPEWNTPCEFRPGVVIDVCGGEWLIESFREETLESDGDETAAQKKRDSATVVATGEREARSEGDCRTQTADAFLPGWRRGKLVLKRLPNGREPAAFGFGKKDYTVPAGKAWKIVLDMIEADAFEGHGVEIPLRASDSFRRNHRVFFTEIIRTDNDGKRYLRTK